MQTLQWTSIIEASEIYIKPVIGLDPNLKYILGLTNKHMSNFYNIMHLKGSDKSVWIQVVT